MIRENLARECARECAPFWVAPPLSDRHPRFGVLKLQAVMSRVVLADVASASLEQTLRKRHG